MSRSKVVITMVAVFAVVAFQVCLSTGRPASTHCDTLGGPVIQEALAALEKGDVTPVLKWVTKDQETEVSNSFKKTLAVRSGGPLAKELADAYFLETLVRLHRQSEGVPYTGLKSAEDVNPAVAAADKAILDGNVDALVDNLQHAIDKKVRDRFARVLEAQKHKDESVDAGRKYVAAYVQFVHFAESLHQLGAAGEHHH